MRIIETKDLPGDFFAGFQREDVPGVRRIVEDVRRDGDAAVRHYSRLLDGTVPDPLQIPRDLPAKAAAALDPPLREALQLAARNIRTFARAQTAGLGDFEVETSPGVFCGQRTKPLDRVGIYVPAGRHPLASSLLMGAIPAAAAGVREIAVCSPPAAGGTVDPVVCAAAGLLGLDEVYAVGGAQAVAAMAFGTESIRRVDKIVGPGNKYVTAAKLEIYGAAGIDLPAGPSEILIVAGGDADPETVAADLAAQAEHDPEAGAFLITASRTLAEAARESIERRIALLPEQNPAGNVLVNRGFILIVDKLEDAVAIADRRAPEHLELQGNEAVALAGQFRNFGALFLGSEAGEVFGDYAAGINHILPTGGTARFTSGLGVRDFLRFQSTLRLAAGGAAALRPAVERLAEIEGLPAHSAAARRRR